MRSVTRKLRRLRAMSWADRALLLEAAGMLPAVHGSLRVMRLQRLFGGLERLAVRLERPAPAERDEMIRRVRTAVGLAAFHGLSRGSCLSRSATLWWLLRRHGVSSRLRIGVRKRDGALDAHAWVECDGETANDHSARIRPYTPFTETLTS